MTKPKPPVDTPAAIARALDLAGQAGGAEPASALTETGLRAFLDLVSRTDRNRPDRGDVLALEDALVANPGIWRSVVDLATRAVDLMIDQLDPTPAAAVSLRRGAAELREALAGVGASPLESVLAEQISVCWVRLRVFEIWLIRATAGGDPVTIRFWETRVTSAQHRFLAACESLARIRRLALRTPQLFQINVAGQQINVTRPPD